MTMNSNKHFFFLLINAVLGLISCIFYLYTWAAFAKQPLVWAWEPMLCLIAAVFTFIIYNMVMLRHERKRYWAQAVFVYVGTIGIFIYFLL